MLKSIGLYFGKFVLAFIPAYIFARLGEMLVKAISDRITGKPQQLPAPAEQTKGKKAQVEA